MKIFKSILTFLFLILLSVSFGISLYPEEPARLLTDPGQTILEGSDKSKVNVQDVAAQFRQLRKSESGADGYFYRNWTAELGTTPLKIKSNIFTPSKYMSVIVTGSTRTPNGQIKAYIECQKNGDRLRVINGSVNANISETVVSAPKKWCSEGARLIFETTERNAYVGIGGVYKISPVSYWKLSFAGQLSYYFATVLLFSFLMFAGAAAAYRCSWGRDPLPVAFVSLGVAALAAFYLPTLLSWVWRPFSSIVVVAVFMVLFFGAGAQARKMAAAKLLPYFRVWTLISLVCLAILCLAYNGLGHWEPNYRFWPASWSSDSELPWFFAEAIRNESKLRELFGGQWMPTDRPPLMTGALLLLSDIFAQLQINNDGDYLRGTAYNVASVALNTLWAPAILWLLSRLAAFLNRSQFTAILLFVACTPFVLFNSVYGWPKALGAAFALVAFGLVWQSRATPSGKAPENSILILFPIMCALSMLAHMSGAFFIAPLGLLYLLWCLRRGSIKQVLIGGGIALSLLASWNIYKYLVLPSTDPVTKYALTGSFGFGSKATTWEMLVDFYRGMNLRQWLEIKKAMFAQAFYPIDHAITNVHLNPDYGANAIDKLRAWDFMLMSAGNSGILVCCAASAWLAVRSALRGRDSAVEHAKPFFALLLASVLTWLMIVILFVAPAVLHHWPQAAIFGLALGGSVITQYRFPQFFKAILLVLLTYTGTVWIISPLQNALAIDMSAAILLVMLLGAAFIYREDSRSSAQGNSGAGADLNTDVGHKAPGLRAAWRARAAS